MITCNHCGTRAPAGLKRCQMCGTPLPDTVENEMNAWPGNNQGGVRGGGSGIQGSQDQAQLPAWLESLRTNERPGGVGGHPGQVPGFTGANGVPASTNMNFSAADLIDGASLPNWMGQGGGRNAGNERRDVADMNATSSGVRPVIMQGPTTDGERYTGEGLQARSLIDEQALPSWMKSGAAEPPVPGSIHAQSLVEPNVLPEWMRAAQAGQANAQPSSPFSSSQMQSAPAMPPQASMPSQALGHQAPGWQDTTFVPDQGFSAKDLIDQQSLPAWMVPQQNQGAVQQPRQQVQNGQQAQPEPATGFGLNAGSLIDADALPYWLRQNGQESSASPSNQTTQPPLASWQASAQASANAFNSQPMGQQAPWSAQQPAMPQPNNTASNGPAISAASFIDMNALPEWLRAGADQQAGAAGSSAQQPYQPFAGNQGPAYGAPPVPPRVENVRVPSRPRGEINPSEGSELAANVFASMLGVASAAPNFAGAPPAGPHSSYLPQSGQLPPAMGGPMPPSTGSLPGAGMAPMIGVAGPTGPGGQGYAQQGGYGAQSMPGVQGGAAGYPQGYPGSGIYPNNPSQYAAGIPPQYPAGIPPQYAAGIPPGMLSAPGQGSDVQKTNAKPAKRGFFEAIRSWLNPRS